MELTQKQALGLKIAIDRYKVGERYTIISGHAGSGKSTLVKFIVEALINEGIDKDLIGYACFTGKAAQVLIEKGNDHAITLHKLLYKARLGADGKYHYYPRSYLPYKIIVVDECSMAPKKLVERLASYKDIYCIFCGDPGQLPPISKDEDNHLLDNPHIFLDEIMRQAQDSGIIRLSMMIRNGENIHGFRSQEANVFTSKQISNEALMGSDINICATNATRSRLNQYIRGLYGFSGVLPNEGEKVINLHNEWEIISSNGNALTNGCIGYMHNIFESYLDYPYYIYKGTRIKTVNGQFITETGDDFGSLYTDLNIFKTGEPALNGQQKYKIVKNKFDLPLEFDFAYAITCWKAQGSEWNNVLVLEENFPRDRDTHTKFLYTAVTRAMKNVTVYIKS